MAYFKANLASPKNLTLTADNSNKTILFQQQANQDYKIRIMFYQLKNTTFHYTSCMLCWGFLLTIPCSHAPGCYCFEPHFWSWKLLKISDWKVYNCLINCEEIDDWWLRKWSRLEKFLQKRKRKKDSNSKKGGFYELERGLLLLIWRGVNRINGHRHNHFLFFFPSFLSFNCSWK